jgi:hypothetical protein
MGRACTMHGAKQNAYMIMVGKPKGKRLGRPIHWWEDNIKMNVQEI